MRRFTVIVIALVLAPGLKAAGISTFPNFILPEVRPEIEVVPENRPEILPEVEAVVPELITINPCDSCFQYMSSLIEQLTDVGVETPTVPELPVVVLPEEEEGSVVGRPLPESVPEDEPIVGRPLPESLPEDEPIVARPVPESVEDGTVIGTLPLPVAPEEELRPLPLPVLTETEQEEELVVQGVPLPAYVIRR